MSVKHTLLKKEDEEHRVLYAQLQQMHGQRFDSPTYAAWATRLLTLPVSMRDYMLPPPNVMSALAQRHRLGESRRPKKAKSSSSMEPTMYGSYGSIGLQAPPCMYGYGQAGLYGYPYGQPPVIGISFLCNCFYSFFVQAGLDMARARTRILLQLKCLVQYIYFILNCDSLSCRTT